MPRKEICDNCENYREDLQGWCEEKKQLKQWNDTCGKFKEAK